VGGWVEDRAYFRWKGKHEFPPCKTGGWGLCGRVLLAGRYNNARANPAVRAGCNRVSGAEDRGDRSIVGRGWYGGVNCALWSKGSLKIMSMGAAIPRGRKPGGAGVGSLITAQATNFYIGGGTGGRQKVEITASNQP